MAALHLNAPNFSILLHQTPDDFTSQWESLTYQLVNCNINLNSNPLYK